ncbi:hypothetical protein BDZ97DRAFT_1914166 [Flammula alnicola]|nr:hypothetical protein BDZ97DRAFT_1914166 [Flammula alnicola]
MSSYPHNATNLGTPQAVGVAPGHAPATSPPLSSFQPSNTRAQTAYPYPNNTSDHVSLSSTSPPYSFQQQQRPIVAPRSTSLPFHLQMGHNQSKSAPPVPTPIASSSSSNPPSAAAKSLNAAVAGGIKLKRAFARRRKNSEDVTTLFSPKGKEHESKLRPGVSSSSLATDKNRTTTKASPAPPVLNQNIAVSPLQSAPPPTPPKKEFPPPSPMQTDHRLGIEVLSAGSRNSVMPISPGISSAVTYISMMDQPQSAGSKQEVEKENVKGPDKREMKENWRKSDSTNSHHTIRPGAAAATPSRSSRPVSWAESFQSAHTVVQGASNRRLSALIGDADFGMLEEDDDDSSSASHEPKSSPASSKQQQHMPAHPSPSVPAADLKYPSHSISEGLLPAPNSSSTIHPSRVPASIAPSASQPQSAAAASNLRGRFNAWTAAPGSPYGPTPPVPPVASAVFFQQRNLSSVPIHPHQQPAAAAAAASAAAASPLPVPTPTTSNSPSSFRQTAISMSSAGGIGPAAAGLAKRAVEKMGRKWGAMGMGMSSSSSGSGGNNGGWTSSSSSSSVNGPGRCPVRRCTWATRWCARARTSRCRVCSRGLGSCRRRRMRIGVGGWWAWAWSWHHKRTPNAASGSISSSVTSGSDSDFFSNPTGPVLGTRLRGALRTKNGIQVVAGVVFGRDLVAGVRETGVRVGKAPQAFSGVGGQGQKDLKEGLMGELEERLLAAWLVNGRPSHASKLRSEFDSGADYDMMECSPGDLDPHAVASIFKAYLRELPEPILTYKLQPLFDAAINKETTNNAADTIILVRQRGRTGSPSGPKSGFSGLRKPPSLSTLAMPSFTGIPPPSKSLVGAIRTLIKQLPVENRDLVRTVVDLIKATARQSKETKMPLSNLLRRGFGVRRREEEVEEMPVIDIRRQTMPPPRTPTKDDEFSDSRSGTEEESDSVASTRPSLDNPSSDYHGSAEESIYEGQAVPRRRRVDFDRSEVPTVYLDSRSHLSSSSASSLMQEPSFLHHSREPSRDDVSVSSGGYSMHNASSPPPLSSSAESVATPTSSGNPSFADLPLEAGGKDQDGHHAAHQRHGPPQIVESTPLELRPPQASKRPMISNPIPITVPIQFPASPQAVTPTVAVKRRSIPVLSLPSFSPTTSPMLEPEPTRHSPLGSPQSAGPGPEKGLRAKKPSLKLLFSKRSASSLNSAKDRTSTGGMSFISPPIPQTAYYRQSPQSGSDSSVSTPLSAVTAPQSSLPGSGSGSMSHLPPVLDTPIEDSSFSLDLVGFEVSPPATATLNNKQQSAPTAMAKDGPSLPAQTSSNPAVVQPLVYLGSRRTIMPGENHIRPQASSSNLSIVSTASSHHLSLFEDDDEEEWAVEEPARAATNSNSEA